MGYFLTTEPETAVPPNSLANPKTHTPDPRMEKRGYRYYMPEVGRWLSRDPLGEEVFFVKHAFDLLISLPVQDAGIDWAWIREKLSFDRRNAFSKKVRMVIGRNLSLFVGNSPLDDIDLFGLADSVGTKFQETSIGGHAALTIDGTGYGFGPSTTSIFWGPGQTSGYESVAEPRTAEGLSIRSTGYFMDDMTTPCCGTTVARIKTCAEHYKATWDGTIYQFPTRTCRTYVSTIIGGCCLKIN